MWERYQFMIFSVMLIYKQKCQYRLRYLFLKLNDKDKSSKKTAERPEFFTLTLQMAFASVTDHNVIKWLPSSWSLCEKYNWK